ncbi:hypothetical protein GALMADRAFT_915835 [Galerina marginata CBS 339.88]|uniref:Uncharacterized protein n=1 Tax=Galerina marginata (strain CBS 339.88) TaxID=685588 RepID=A0A067SF79_GALM3|nr:hypothetical protein GALMADRAFT_915835 [Galerina marginata CBS 339.88]
MYDANVIIILSASAYVFDDALRFYVNGSLTQLAMRLNIWITVLEGRKSCWRRYEDRTYFRKRGGGDGEDLGFPERISRPPFHWIVLLVVGLGGSYIKVNVPGLSFHDFGLSAFTFAFNFLHPVITLDHPFFLTIFFVIVGLDV